jgi:hypothetical protein
LEEEAGCVPCTHHVRTAVLAAYQAALDEDVSRDTAVELAVRRYRAFFPTISEVEVRRALANAIAANGAVQRAVGEKNDLPAPEAHVQVGSKHVADARVFRMKAEELNTVADCAVDAD